MPLTESSELLTTKLAVPRREPSSVPRAPLLARLDRGLERKLTLLSAPPGFGKTTLVSEWVAARTEPVAWVSLDAGDNDPIRFWRYAIAACRNFDAALGKSVLAALRTSQQPSLEVLLTPFINELAKLPNRCMLVLDDYHLITSPQVHETVTFLLDHFPASLHLILITRSEPPLPLARLRARNELSELNTADMRFSPAETYRFLQQTLDLPLSAEWAARLDERTEGWAAGLRVVAVALEGRHEQAEAEKLLATFTGGERHILDYLVGEVLAAQAESVQTFLLQTSFLNRLTASLCDTITGRNDGAQMLEQLARANLFLTPSGTEGEYHWYRYHTLFAEAMQHQARRLWGEPELHPLYDKAAVWYEAHGLLDHAIESSIAAHAFERAAAWIERLIEQRGPSEIYTLRRWIEQLPEEVLDHHPDLCFTLATALFFTVDRFLPTTVSRVEVPLRAAEQAWRNEKNDAKLGRVLSLRAIMVLWQGELHRAFAYARESLELLSDDDANWRGNSLICVGMEELFAGSTASAQNRFIEARALCGAAQNIHGVLAALTLSADTCIWQGEFDQATALYQQVLADAVGGEAMLDDQGAAHQGLAVIAFERNDLESAEQHAMRVLEVSQPRSNEQLLVDASLILARVQQARGKATQAQAMLHALVTRIRQPRLLRQILAWQARFALMANDLDAVRRWYASIVQDDDLPRVQQEQEELLTARMYIADGKPDVALKLMEPWRADAHAHGRTRSEIETRCIKSLAQFAQSNREQAKKTIVRALTSAQLKNYRRIFLDEGEPMIQLLQAIVPQIDKRSLATYATVLLRAFVSNQSPQLRATGSPLVELLSAQELRVLRLLAAGLSNPEIARELVVSTNTIKTHVQSIYRKLNVTNRDQAADIARQLNLL